MMNLCKKMPQYSKRIGKSSAGWREIGNQKCYFRSRWEANFSRYLELLKTNNQIKAWFHEPHTFWFHEIMRGIRSYKPDFKVIESHESHIWYEVKGYSDAKSRTKMKRMKKYYPDEKITIIDGKWFFKNGAMLSRVISGWEYT